MSLFRASGLRCHIRSPRISHVAQRSTLVPLRRYYSEDASPESRDPIWVTDPLPRSPVPRVLRKHTFAVLRPGLVTVSKEVLTAMENKTPILGLETAIYTHGFPKPDNYNLALEMEEVVRAEGATPATIGILNGKILIGMTPEELKELTESAGSENTHKISRRDIAYHIGASGPPLNGGTTIAGTILISKLAGIEVIATGGLGGVHKGGENSLDISADLTELARNNVSVVTSGMKSFLDIPRTLEFLETHGVFVSTFGKKAEKVDIPGFFSRESGYSSPYVVESPQEAALISYANYRLKLGSGNLFFNPIPEQYEIPKSEMDPIIASAVEKSSSIIGKDNTPAVLNEIVKQTEGRSIEANRHLVLSNAKIGAQMAIELKRLYGPLDAQGREADREAGRGQKKPTQTYKKRVPKPERKSELGTETESNSINGTNGILRKPALNRQPPPNMPSGRRSFSTLNQPELEDRKPDETPEPEAIPEADNAIENINIDGLPKTSGILVVGGVGIDVVGKATTGNLLERTSNPGEITFTVGGVGKNVAATIRQLDPPGPVRFLSAVGKDMNGIAVLQELKGLDLSVTDITVINGARTACYAALNSVSVEGGLSAAVADMDIITKIEGGVIAAAIEKYKPQIVCFDGNLDPSAMKELCIAAKAHGALAVCEPTSLPKSVTIATMLASLSLELDHSIDMISPNSDELKGIFQTIQTIQTAYDQMTNVPPAQSEVKAKLEEKSKRYNAILEFHKNTIARLYAQLRHLSTKTRYMPFKHPKEHDFMNCVTRSVSLLPFIPTVITKLGAEGVIVVRLVKHPNPVEAAIKSRYMVAQNIYDNRKHHGQLKPGEGRVNVECLLPAEPYDTVDQVIGIHIFWARAAEQLNDGSIVSSNGAGDTFLGAFLHSMIHKDNWLPANIIASPWKYFEGEQLENLVHKAQYAAVQTLMSHGSHPRRGGDSLESLKQWQEEMWKQAFRESEEIKFEMARPAVPSIFRESGLKKKKKKTKKTKATTTALLPQETLETGSDDQTPDTPEIIPPHTDPLAPASVAAEGAKH